MTDPRIDPIIAAIFDKIPPPEKPWTEEYRATWFRVLDKAVRLIYPTSEVYDEIVQLPSPPEDRP